MRRSFYKKLTASYLVVITVVFAAGMIYLHFGLSAQLMEQAEENLSRNARLARHQLVSSTSENPQSHRMDALADEIGRAAWRAGYGHIRLWSFARGFESRSRRIRKRRKPRRLARSHRGEKKGNWLKRSGELEG